MSNKLFRMDSGSWLTSDITDGVGRGEVNFSVDPWRGREDRVTLRVVRSGRNMKASTFRQLGTKINEVSVERVHFPSNGGDIQILLTTNAPSLNAKLSSSNNVFTKIKAFTTASGLDINVNSTSLNYAFPGDPGLKDVFQVSIILSAPDNIDGNFIEEFITINEILIPITVDGIKKDYARFETEFAQVGYNDFSYSVNIDSNISKYIIEISECVCENESNIILDNSVINLNSNGDYQYLNVKTEPENLAWRITE